MPGELWIADVTAIEEDAAKQRDRDPGADGGNRAPGLMPPVNGSRVVGLRRQYVANFEICETEGRNQRKTKNGLFTGSNLRRWARSSSLFPLSTFPNVNPLLNNYVRRIAS